MPQEALRIGMVNKLVPPEKLTEETMKFTKNIAGNHAYCFCQKRVTKFYQNGSCSDPGL